MIDVIIVNWNSGEQIQDCIAAVLDSGSEMVSRIIVVDNGSTDGSADALAQWTNVRVISAGENLGFSAACNVGAAAGDSRYLLFLNPDVRVEGDSIPTSLAFMERLENADVGICGIQLVDEAGEVSRTCARFPSVGRFVIGALGIDKIPPFHGRGMRMADWLHNETRAVDHIIGAFYLIRRDIFDRLDGFDERFFLYLEDLDLSIRVKEAGWKSVFLPTARAFHAGGGTSRQVKAHRLFYSLRSRLLYAFKHFPRWQAWLLVGVAGVVEPLSRTAWCLARRDWPAVRHTWTAYRMLWVGMGRIIRGEGRFIP